MDDHKFSITKTTAVIGGAIVGKTAEAMGHLTLSDWASIAAIVYTLMQIGLLVPKYYRALKEKMQDIGWLKQ